MCLLYFLYCSTHESHLVVRLLFSRGRVPRLIGGHFGGMVEVVVC